MENTDDYIDETEVWQKFSATHSYRRDSDGVMQLVSSKYFRLDPFGIEPVVEISKAELIAGLEPASSVA